MCTWFSTSETRIAKIKETNPFLCCLFKEFAHVIIISFSVVAWKFWFWLSNRQTLWLGYHADGESAPQLFSEIWLEAVQSVAVHNFTAQRNSGYLCTMSTTLKCQTPFNRQTDTSDCQFVRCVCQGRPSYGERSAMLHRNLRERDKNQGSTINTRNFVGWLPGKSLKLLPPDVTF